MKKIFLFLILFFTSYFLQAQLQTKWTAILYEPLASPKVSPHSIFSLQIENFDSKTLYINGMLPGGWQVSAIDIATGQYKWKAARTMQSPKLDSVQYWPSSLTTDENGNIVELGMRTFPKYPTGTLVMGSIAKAVYDKNTGKELSYIDHIDEIARYFYLPFNLDGYTKSYDGKNYYILQSGTEFNHRIFLRRVDAKTFTKQDTLYKYRDTTYNNETRCSYLFQFGNNKLYHFIETIKENTKDSTAYKIEYVRNDSTGKETHKRLDISKYFYYYRQDRSFVRQTNDGYIFIGESDSTKVLLSGDKSKKLAYIMKIDTAGKLVWRIWHPINYMNSPFTATKLIDDEIYVVKNIDVMTGYGKKELLQINVKNGSVKNYGEFKVKDETRKYRITKCAATTNKDFVFDIIYEECQKGVSVGKDVVCFGVGFISNEDIAKTTDIKEENILTENISVYPNPVENQLQVLLPTVTAFEYFISDVTGRIVKKENVIATNFYEIGMQDLQKGIYFINIKTIDKQFFVKKVIKQENHNIMKKIFLLLILFFTSYFLQAQLQTKWMTALEQPPEFPQKKYKVLPLEMRIYDNTIYVNSFASSSGWQISAINPTNGSYKWKALRNYESPKLDSLQYFPSNLVTDENGNIVQLGIRCFAKYPNDALPWGSIAKAVYDKNTGKELSYIDHFDEIVRYYYMPARVGTYTKSYDGKNYYLLQSAGDVGHRVFLRRIEAKKFTKMDTIHRIIDSTKNEKDYSRLLQFGNNKLTYFLTTTFVNKPLQDSNRVKIEYIRMDSTGKEAQQRVDISKYFFYYNDIGITKQLKDGFLFIGESDSTKLILSGDKSKKLAYIMKIDTAGKLVWRIWYPPSYMNAPYVASEVIDDEIYFVKYQDKITGYAKKELLKLNIQNGSVKNYGEFKVKDEIRKYKITKCAATTNKDFVFDIIYEECQKSVVGKDVVCFGVGFISNEDIAKTTDIKEENILTENISVYPNPVENQLQVLLPTVTAFEYYISDVAGRIMKKENVIATNFYQIGMQDLQKGIYFINIKTTDKQFFTKKIVKQ